MEAKVSEILENILGLLALEGSFEVVEGVDEIKVSIDTDNPGRLIGFRGETLDALQLLVNQILGRMEKDNFKRVVIDVSEWRKNKEGETERKARGWAQQVLDSNSPLELDPMPAWQRRIVHLVVEEVEGVESESSGEGRDRHLVIRPTKASPAKSKTKKEANKKSQKLPN